MRLIDADALRQTMESNLYWGLDSDGAILDTIDDAPTVDAAPVVHGRWLTSEEYANQGNNGWVYCSECEQPMRDFYGWGYCPNCGAKMDGGTHE